MLKRMLDLIASAKFTSVESLAAELGVNPPLARQMLDDLARQGYLRAPAQACPQGCAHCPLAHNCHGLPALWVLTEKGKRAISQGKS